MKLFHVLENAKSEEFCTRIRPGSVNLILTDPPFGVDNLSNQSVTESGKKYARKIANDESPEIAIQTFKRVTSVLLPKTADESDMYIFTSYQVLPEWLVMTDDFCSDFGFKRKAIIVWAKEGPGMGDTNCPWGMGCEFILYFQKGRREKDTTRRNNVIHTPQLRPNELIHPHEKPTALLEILIKASTAEGDFIVDPFSGSGSTVRAARICNRSALGIEYDKKNHELALKKLNTESDSIFG